LPRLCPSPEGRRIVPARFPPPSEPDRLDFCPHIFTCTLSCTQFCTQCVSVETFLCPAREFHTQAPRGIAASCTALPLRFSPVRPSQAPIPGRICPRLRNRSRAMNMGLSRPFAARVPTYCQNSPQALPADLEVRHEGPFSSRQGLAGTGPPAIPLRGFRAGEGFRCSGVGAG
jgi:hypothetical protein